MESKIARQAIGDGEMPEIARQAPATEESKEIARPRGGENPSYGDTSLKIPRHASAPEKYKENPMRQIRVEKVVVNIGIGEAGERLERAKSLLGLLTGKKVVVTKARKRTTFGSAKGRALGVAVALRGKDALAFLKRAHDAVDGKLRPRVFDTQGNFSFGIKEHISMPGVRYDPEIGIWGMDVCVRLERRGYRVSKKRIGRKVGKRHRITTEEARDWVIKNLGFSVEQE